jgi:hypothetical protein
MLQLCRPSALGLADFDRSSRALKSQEWTHRNFSLGAKRSTDVNYTATAANKRLHLRIQPNRQPLRLNSEAEMAPGENLDSPSQTERKACKTPARTI